VALGVGALVAAGAVLASASHRRDEPMPTIEEAKADAIATLRQGLVVDASHKYINEEAGTDYIANARVKDAPHPSAGATDLLAHISVDSVCVPGDPDDFR
jgi:hypothetical protein